MGRKSGLATPQVFAAATNCTPSLSGMTWAANDLLFFVVTQDNNAATNITASAGFTEVGAGNQASVNNSRTAIFYKAPPADPNLSKAVALMVARAAEPTPQQDDSLRQAMMLMAQAMTAWMAREEKPAAPMTLEHHTHVAAPSVTVENRQEAQAAPNVEVRVEALMPEQPAPIVEVTVEQPDEMTMHIASMPDRVTTSDVERNMAGEITKARQIEADA